MDSDILRCNARLKLNFLDHGEEKLMKAIENIGVFIGGEGSDMRKKIKEMIQSKNLCKEGRKVNSNSVS